MSILKQEILELNELVTTAREMAEIDRFTIEEIGLPGIVLMETAGRKVADFIVGLLADQPGANVLIVCGKGNNGGDGYVIARVLQNAGFRVNVVMLAESKEIKGDAAANLAILDKLGFNCQLYEQSAFEVILGQATLVVDALLGTGVSGPLRGKIQQIVEQINLAQKRVVAVDLPTGMNTDTGAVDGVCAQATHTVTIGHLKRGLLFSPAREFAGQVHVADIGFPALASRQQGILCYRTGDRHICTILPNRRPDTFKNQQGKVLVVAGSEGMTGAAALTAQATLKVGAGLTILGTPKSVNPVLEQKLTEVMTLPLPETGKAQLSFKAKDAIAEKLAWADVLAVGPGIGNHDETAQLVEWLLKTCESTIVVDADALNCLAQKTDVLSKARGDLILTPHPGELARLLNMSSREVTRDVIGVAQKAAATFGAVVVLKGGPAVTTFPDGLVFINSTGNPGMATAGMGDVLTGVIAGLAAQGMSPFDAAVAGVYLHGLAGDLCRDELGEAGLVSGSVLERLPHALLQFEAKERNRIEHI